MHPSVRLLRLELASIQSPRPQCFTCIREVIPRSSIARQVRYNSSDKPFSERVRRRIWGTDSPPGLKDPYGGQGVLERRWGGKKQQSEEPEEVEQEADFAPSEEYVEAKTWDGLQRIGHLNRWSDRGPKKADAYEPFLAERKVSKASKVAPAAHQAAVEISLMQMLKNPLTAVCEVREHDPAILEMIMACKIRRNASWNSAIRFPDQQTKEALIYVFSQIGRDQAAETTTEQTTESEELGKKLEQQYNQTRNGGSQTLALNDPSIKFAYLKRFSQLTGQRLPDAFISGVTRVKQIVEHLDKKNEQAPKKLAVELTQSSTLQNLPNVKVFSKRQTPAHKDQEFGRWKLIDAELRERGLA